MPLNIDWQQILLHLLNFVVLFAILYFLLYKPVKAFMDKRTEHYRQMDEEAKKNVSESERIKEEYRQKLDAAEDEITAERKKARAEIEAATAARMERAEAEAQKVLSDARRDIEHERNKMLHEAQNEITGMVESAAEKLVAQSTTSEAFDQFLDAAKRGSVNE